jgi:hypothetical protein
MNVVLTGAARATPAIISATVNRPRPGACELQVTHSTYSLFVDATAAETHNSMTFQGACMGRRRRLGIQLLEVALRRGWATAGDTDLVAGSPTIPDVRDYGATIMRVEQSVGIALRLTKFTYVLEAGNVALEGEVQMLHGNDHVKRACLGG